MSTHFSSFTPEAMRAFGQELAADLRARTEALKSGRDHTCSMLACFRKDRQEAEAKRRQGAEQQADARRLFMSELSSGVHSLLARFELSRKEMAGDLQEMAGELRAACDAFRNRPGRQGGFVLQRSRQPKQPQPGLSAQPLQAAAAVSHDSAKPRSGGEGKHGHSKKRHG